MAEFKIEGENISFWMRVKPRSSHERLKLDGSGDLRLEIHAPALDGQANKACIEFLARTLRLPKASVAILTGHKTRRKLVRVAGNSAKESIARLEKSMTTGGG